MISRYRNATSAALFAAICCSAFHSAKAADDAPLSFRFSETLRVRKQQTVVDRMNGSLTENVSSESGAVRLDASVPLNGDPALDPSTPVVVSAGSFTVRSTLDADPRYRVGRHQASILLTAPSGSGKSLVVYGHAKITWTKDSLTVHVDGSIPALAPVCARDFLTGPAKAGAAKGETRAQLEVGPIRAAARITFDVKSTARSVNGGHYVDSGLQWKYLNASPGEMEAGRHTAQETTVTATGRDAA